MVETGCSRRQRLEAEAGKGWWCPEKQDEEARLTGLGKMHKQEQGRRQEQVGGKRRDQARGKRQEKTVE